MLAFLLHLFVMIAALQKCYGYGYSVFKGGWVDVLKLFFALSSYFDLRHQGVNSVKVKIKSDAPFLHKFC